MSSWSVYNRVFIKNIHWSERWLNKLQVSTLKHHAEPGARKTDKWIGLGPGQQGLLLFSH